MAKQTPKPKTNPPAQPKGRPRVLTETLPDDWRNLVLNAYEDGAADIQICALILRISRNTFNRLLADDADFLNTITRGRELAEAYWVKLCHKAIYLEDGKPKYSHQILALNLRNRFGWDAKNKSSAEDLLTEIVVDYIRPAIRKMEDNEEPNPETQNGE